MERVHSGAPPQTSEASLWITFFSFLIFRFLRLALFSRNGRRLGALSSLVSRQGMLNSSPMRLGERAGRFSFPALLLGASAIGLAPILVRLSEVGPTSTAFYRLALALPVLLIWCGFSGELRRRENGAVDASSRSGRHGLGKAAWAGFALAGFLFAGDLAFWHASIRMTTVTNATLLTNLAPLLVMAGARFWFFERITPAVLTGFMVASAGAVLLVGGSFQLSLEHVLGDLLALVTAIFYAGYLLTVKHLRAQYSTVAIMAFSGLFSSLFLLLASVAMGESLWVGSTRGWMLLILLALFSHVGGQGMITYALAHLPASFSSVSLLLQPVVAAALAWLLLAERLGIWQLAGGAVVLTGIVISSFSGKGKMEDGRWKMENGKWKMEDGK
jgi:drug/metabolite transporter (DMT)-like permease